VPGRESVWNTVFGVSRSQCILSNHSMLILSGNILKNWRLDPFQAILCRNWNVSSCQTHPKALTNVLAVQKILDLSLNLLSLLRVGPVSGAIR
jgi:hypothetical protein